MVRTCAPSKHSAGAWPARFEAAPFAPGDLLDLAFTIDRDGHKDFGERLQLCLCDFARCSSSI